MNKISKMNSKFKRKFKKFKPKDFLNNKKILNNLVLNLKISH